MRNLLYKPNTLIGGLTTFDDIFNEIFDTDKYYPKQVQHKITNNDDSIELKIDVPGFKKSEININYENNQLIINAIKNNDSDNRSDILKTFKIENINIKKSIATLEDGVLTITLEKTNSAKKQQLKIN